MEEENKRIDEANLEEQKAPEETASEVTAPVEEAPIAAAEEAPVEKKDEAAEEKDEKGKKPITKTKKILNAIVLGVQIAFVVLSITICLVMLLNPKAQDEVSPLGVKLLTVNSPSMDGTEKDSFGVNDLVIAKNPKNGGEGLQKGDIITFKMLEKESGLFIINTHRIDEVITENGFTQYKTKGDANPMQDPGWVSADNVLAVYAFHIKGLGKAIKWVRDGYHFIFVVIIPLGLLLIYNIYLVAQIVVEGKMKKAKVAAAEAAAASARANLSEEDLLRLLKERGIDPAAIKKQDDKTDDTGSDQ
ncbi:MAG: signal peptidase I [Clostridia bacterium]|nr:signal peptidase I [Clostridia bacterium]